MKRFFALAALVLGLAACQTEPEGLDVQMGGEVATTITVSIPETETRAGGNNSALGVFDNGILNGNATMRYILQVYYGETASQERLVQYSDGKEVNFDVRLVPGRAYKFVAWADVVDGEADTDKHYNTADLKNVTLNGAWDPMDESRDAFTDVKEVTNFNAASVINLTLTRPFAKLRVKTTDMVEMDNIDVAPAYATVEYTTPYRAAFNAFEGKAVAAGSEKKAHNNFVIADYGDNVVTGDKQTKILFTDYFFAEEGDAVSFILNVYEANGELIKSNNFNTDIAVNRNYLTTIQGNILTDGNNITVTVEDRFVDADGNNQYIDYKTISSDAEFRNALNTPGKYIVISNIHVANAGDTVTTLATRANAGADQTTVINLNGKTITLKTNITIAEGKNITITDINENGETGAIVSEDGGAIVNNGTLKIEGGNIESNSTNDAPAIVNNGTLNIEGGNFGEDTIENTQNGNVTITNDNIDNNVVTGNTTNVTNYAKGLEEAFTNGGEHTLEADVTLNKSLTLAAGKTLALNLNGKTIFGKTSGNTNPQDLFLVKGNLTVENGTIIAEHVGENMGWGGQATIFNITAGGEVSLNGVTAKHLGGSDMNFVAHLNNWGEATFNAENCTLEATYIAVRAFNSGYDMNNVTITNSTLKGKYCFWVHNYKEAGDNSGTDATLNINIFDQGNTFEYTGVAPVLYGFDKPLYFDAEGKLLAFNVEDLKKYIGKDNQRSEVVLANNIELNEQLNIAKEFTLDLNGKTITGTDTITGSFGLITNKGNLTVKNGKMTLVAQNNRGWNAYSSVISNNPGGNLVVENVTIEHLGGTDMAYGIDNLTNGKGTSAVATINDGAIVKSPYRAIRQFLNGVEANNSLTVNVGAVIEGANKSIWMQDPNANANTGTLVVNEGATLNGDVYLFVCAGSTSWPVSVSIAASAVNGNVLTGNVPEGYVVVEENGAYVVKKYEVVANGLYKKDTKTYLVMNAEGLVALSGKTIEGNKVVELGADIDLTDVEFKGLYAFNPETPNTFNGQNFTVSNWTNNSKASDMGFFKGWVGTIKNVNFENCHLQTSGRSAIVAANTYCNIDNVNVNNCSIEDSYWACGIIAGLYNSGSISNCTVTNSSVKSNGGTGGIVGAINESTGVRALTNCSVSNTTINNTGAYGADYSGGGLVGLFNAGNATYKFSNCSVSNNNLVGEYVYEMYPADESANIVVE